MWQETEFERKEEVEKDPCYDHDLALRCLDLVGSPSHLISMPNTMPFCKLLSSSISVEGDHLHAERLTDASESILII